ncbi:MAG: ATP-binding protein [Lachnospiraceae bacterium]|nr:ATP-binding protein [Lachnospiraceae bacterium]
MQKLIEKKASQERAVRQYLRGYLDKKKDDVTLSDMLEDIGEYYEADRAYIFEIDANRQFFRNTYEWCREGVKPEIDDLQNVPVEGLEFWIETFEAQGEFYISSLSEDYVPGSPTYEILAPQGIESLMAAAITKKDKVIGFLGVDNPRKNTDAFLLLTVAASTCYSEIATKRMLHQKMAKTEEELIDRKKIIHSMSEIYTSVFYINMDTGRFSLVEAEDRIKDLIGTSGVTREKLAFFCDQLVAPSFRAEVEAFVDLDTLEERLKDKKIISKQYLSLMALPHASDRKPVWAECSIIVGDRHDDGTLSHVIFTTRSIHDEKTRELDNQAKLKEAYLQTNEMNRELQKNFKIFESLGAIYASMYYIDLKANHFTEITSIDRVKQCIGETGDAKERLDFFAEYMMPEEFKASMKAFVDLSTLEERLGDKQIIFEEFRSKLIMTGDNQGTWRVACFIEAGRDENGALSHVIFATQSIQEAKVRELDNKEKLEKALAATEIANRAKTRFLFNMSHDIRTPMNAIIGFRDLLERHQDDREKREDYLAKIKSANEVLLSIINNVLEMTRIEQSSLELDETAGSVEQYCDGIRSMFKVMMEEKGIDFTIAINVEHPYVFCDVTKSREVLINLLSNAYKYTEEGGSVTLRIDELPTEQTGYTTFRTTVQDTGIGMSEKYLPHIFDEFSREKNTTDAKIEGTGLGMPIVKQLVDFLGGSIEVQSEKGVGTTVTVELPHRIARQEDCYTLIDRSIDPRLFEGKRILLAEDNELNAEIALEILRESGFVVDHAEDGRVCYDMIDNAPAGTYDLVLMDIQMPHMNGYDAAVAIRQLPDEAKASIPIVAMTANAFEEDKKEAYRCGMNGHLAKPINVKDILKQLSQILRAVERQSK